MRRFSLATFVGFGLVCVLYLMTAIGGYYLFGSATKGDVLLNFPSKCVLGRGAVGTTETCSRCTRTVFPLALHPRLCGCSDIPAVVARVCIVLIVLGCYPLAFNAHRSNVILLLPLRWQAALNAPAPAELLLEGAESQQSLGSDSSAALLLPGASHSLQAEPARKATYTPISSRVGGASLWHRLLREVPHAMLTAGLVTTSMIIGILVPNVEVILAYKGALGGSCELSQSSVCVWGG